LLINAQPASLEVRTAKLEFSEQGKLLREEVTARVRALHSSSSKDHTNPPASHKQTKISSSFPLNFYALLPRRAKLTAKPPKTDPLRKIPHATVTQRT
jgi:hypothetical protein